MSPLTRPYRQALATLSLALFTVVPTIYVGIVAYRIHRPGHLRDVEIEMGRSLGLQVTLEGVRYPKPGEVVYEGIVLRQEEPRKGGLTEIARAGSVRLRKTGRTLTLETQGLKLRGEGPKNAMAQLGGLIGRSADSGFDRVSLAAPACSIALGDLALEVRELAASFQNDRNAPSLRGSYRVVDDGGSTRCELELTRDRGRNPVATTLAFKTMEGVPLPARMLDVFFDSAEWLGRESRVQGALTLHQAGHEDWKADFTGEFIGVDLGTLFTQRFPRHRLTGLARVSVKSARWEDRPGQGFGWAEAEGEVVTGPGSAGMDLLKALVQEMKFQVARRIDGSKSDIPFRSLGFKFKLDRDGQIQFGGALPSEFAPDDVLVVNDRAAIKAPQGMASVRGLIKTLFPSTADAMVPATAEAQMLSRFLPLPKAGTPRDDSTLKTIHAN